MQEPFGREESHKVSSTRVGLHWQSVKEIKPDEKENNKIIEIMYDRRENSGILQK